ncbi:MAG: IcmT/TraK family protein [Alphaproteobacteria bacterium]|nr:IcmT/TraK family protein [Alphaproteobacteria bacterium]
MDLHWRNTQKPARFFFLDARCFLAILLFLVHARMWTLILAVSIMLTFWLLERRGMTFESALRALRCWVWGSVRPAKKRLAKRRWIDYG